MGGIYTQIRQRQCRALTLCCCHETARVCVATSCGARFIQFQFYAMESAWSMACVILPQTRAAAIACAVLLASLWFEVFLCCVTNQIKSPRDLKLRGWEFTAACVLHGSGCDPTPRQTPLLRTMQIRFCMTNLRGLLLGMLDRSRLRRLRGDGESLSQWKLS